MGGIGHRSRTAVLARDPDSLAYARSVFRFLTCSPAVKMKTTLASGFILPVEMGGIEPPCR